MEIITREVFDQLCQKEGESLVSIYMPTHPVGREMQQDPVRLKNLLSEARRNLESRGLRKPEIDDLLSPAESLLLDSFFWQHQSDGLALFISPESCVNYRLPVDFSELLVIGERFHLKPLLPLLSEDGQFFILALSQGEIRLFDCSRFSATEVDLEHVPTSLREALRFDDPEKQLQYHTGTATPGSQGQRDAMYHGQGVIQDDQKSRLLRYFQQVDKGLMELLQDERFPLILAGVDYLAPIYRQANSYPHLVESFIAGNPEDLSAEALHQRAWEIVEPVFRADQHQAIGRFAEIHGSGSEMASVDLETIVKAAHFGQVETLFVALDIQLWGRFDPSKSYVERHAEYQAGDRELLDLAAINTRKNGGMVYALESEKVPEKAPLVAIFRYKLKG